MIGGTLPLFQIIKAKQVVINSIWLEGEQKHWRRKRKGNTKFAISYLGNWKEKENIFKLLFWCFDYFLSMLLLLQDAR